MNCNKDLTFSSCIQYCYPIDLIHFDENLYFFFTATVTIIFSYIIKLFLANSNIKHRSIALFYNDYNCMINCHMFQNYYNIL